MCSHESVTWEKTDNSVADRMTEKSLIHRFRPSRVLRRRTKVLNAEMKKRRGMKDYRHYVELKTNVLRSLPDDADTEDSSGLTDGDYDIIYSSPSKQARYTTRNSEKYCAVFTSEDDCKSCKSQQKKKSRGKSSTGRRVERTKRSLRSNAAVSETCIDTGWQEVRKRTSGASRSCKRLYTRIADNEGDLQDNDLKARFSKQSHSPRFDSQNSTASSIATAGNEYVRQDRRDSVAMNELSSKDNTRFKKTKRVSFSDISDERKNRKNQSPTSNESNTKFDSPGSHYQSSLSQSKCLENNIDSNNELNSLVESKTNNSNSKLTTIIDESLINAKNYDKTCVSRKPELLKNVRRNLASALEEADSMNNDKDVKTDKYVENELNCDQLLPDITDFRHSTPLPVTKTRIDIREMKDSSPDQQKDSGIDEDSQDRFVKNKESNKVSMNQNTEENAAERMPISSPQPKKTDELVETTEDCKEIAKDTHLRFNNDISGEQVVEEEKKHSEEEQMKNSSQLNPTDTNTIEENEKDEQFVTAEHSNDIQKQQLLSPKQDCVEKAHSEHCNLIQEKEDNGKIKKSAEKEELSSQLNKMDNNTEVDEVVSSINDEGKQDSEEEESEKEIKNFRQLSSSGNITEIYSTNEDQTDFVKSKNSCDIQKQQVLLPKENHIEDVHNILEDNGQANEKKEEKNFPQLNDIDKDVKKQQLPKVTCTEVFNKKYKIIDKKDNDIESNSEKINNINNNTDISNQDTPVKKNTLIHCSDATDHSTDNWQEATISEEIDTPTALETDNEEDNVNYMSPQTKKRLEQQARLNLVVSDSSESDDEYVTTKTSRIRFDNSGMSHCSDNDDVGSQESLTESLLLRVSESNISCNTEESVNQFRRDRPASLLDKENMCINQKKETNVESETRRESVHEQRTQSSTECSNAHLNISCQYRPRNIQQLVEDQELVIETMPTSFTLADLSDNEEAFIMNVPSKVVQSNLQGQPLTLKEKSIKFNKSKYRIVCKEVGTTSCIFATGKKRKPYKLINIKEISTITVREKLPQDSRKSNVSNTYDTVSSVPKSIKNYRQKIQDKRNSKMLKVSNYRQKRKRRESSDSETGCQR